MFKGTKIRRISLILVGAVAVCIVGAFAVVSNKPAESENVGGPLEDVIENRESWDVAFAEWSGKAAPDFTVKDIDGVEHRLSDYRGRNVVVVFWATWCPACKVEIPHLIELRKEFKQDDLVILAISNETAGQLKQSAADKGINYTVVSRGDEFLPRPFSDVRSIPTNFFIDRNGNVKLVALGLVSLEDSRAILKAEL